MGRRVGYVKVLHDEGWLHEPALGRGIWALTCMYEMLLDFIAPVIVTFIFIST